jgi:hypothetical protein
MDTVGLRKSPFHLSEIEINFLVRQLHNLVTVMAPEFLHSTASWLKNTATLRSKPMTENDKISEVQQFQNKGAIQQRFPAFYKTGIFITRAQNSAIGFYPESNKPNPASSVLFLGSSF